ncbi:MAG: TIGR01244 family sulfur transferase [Alphaproteobacteria bacterium]
MIGNKVTEELTVSPQITADDIQAIKAAGFRSVLCNRPDGEESRQPAFAAIEAAATAAGLEVRHQPVASGQMTKEDVAAFKAALATLPGPVFAYCRSGTRCITLWALGESAERPMPEVLQMARDAGYDLGG